MYISNSVQSMNPDVLKEIKRKNLSPIDLEKNKDGLQTIRQEPEIIIPLPNETKKTFFDGLNSLLDSGKNQRFAVFQTLVLTNTEMANEATKKKFGLEIKYKQHFNLYAWIDGQFVCETERVVAATNTMSLEDFLSCRTYAMVLDSVLRFEPIHEIFKFLESFNVKNSDFASILIDNIENQSGGLKESVKKFRENLILEMHGSENEVIDFMKKNEHKYDSGEMGGGNLKYSNMLWVDHFQEIFDTIFSSLKEVLNKNNLKLDNEVDNLEKYLTAIYVDRLDEKSPEIVSKFFDYDLLKWSKSNGVTKLEDFRSKTKYEFKKTPVSNIESKYIWQNLGFSKKGDTRDVIDAHPEINFSGEYHRLYISKLRRDIKLDLL